MSDPVFATPKSVQDVAECVFYHTMDLPGVGEVQGQFDLRGRERDYLGHVDLKGKRVLEIGPASGYLSLYMERQGAEVVSCDLSADAYWDFVPFARVDQDAVVADVRAGITRLNNSYWLTHRLNQSKNRVVYSSVYDIPDAVGLFDIGTLSSTLLHMENPFRAIASVARRVRETMVVTEVLGFRNLLAYHLTRWLRPSVAFVPDPRPFERWTGPLSPELTQACLVWWHLTPLMVRKALAVVGFEHTELRYHRQVYLGRKLLYYTVVGHRTVPIRSNGSARATAPADAARELAADATA